MRYPCYFFSLRLHFHHAVLSFTTMLQSVVVQDLDTCIFIYCFNSVNYLQSTVIGLIASLINDDIPYNLRSDDHSRIVLYTAYLFSFFVKFYVIIFISMGHLFELFVTGYFGWFSSKCSLLPSTINDISFTKKKIVFMNAIIIFS